MHPKEILSTWATATATEKVTDKERAKATENQVVKVDFWPHLGHSVVVGLSRRIKLIVSYY